ncbi:MAG: hypothetical protein EOS70_30995 [Mesorhizobium sp.]|nr:MAG: hypothetical protein EOS51_32355 [Mesorhizobium sp.]RWC26687.1 MAG: hypothetical protein EOS70_30995 [Mesorhizobium sp.]RWD36431.1 MAG: hypothetical protein EOS34_11285 [Mesorhizobium sp.]RWD41346.1 MAG: hypothetical protein EOS35_28275 [Mesorhizobium sp.]RWD77208.1 MAG: hypothetical protein EOS48_29765 [Mesorhizobium sp.]
MNDSAGEFQQHSGDSSRKFQTRTGRPFANRSFEIGRDDPSFVILGRSKERSDAAQTPGSMP